MDKNSAMPIDRLVALPEVIEITSLSQTTIYRKIKKGLFPNRVAISSRRVAWRQSEIDNWLTCPT